ncbi:MAG: phosphate ABC transporter permease subunit PstC [Verrucomicrobiota bacterium]|nr:phosphate ABC transporter permease subunit PstC [Verrucomicrobiota bacterium]
MIKENDIFLSKYTALKNNIGGVLINGILFLVASLSTIAIIFIFYFVAKDAIPFFRMEGFWEFFTSTNWYPSAESPEFGALSLFTGTFLVTLGAAIIAVPLGIVASVCLSDILPFHLRQIVKPIIEVLAAIPSVAYGFFALVILAPLLQERGSEIIIALLWCYGIPVLFLLSTVIGEICNNFLKRMNFKIYTAVFKTLLFFLGTFVFYKLTQILVTVNISSGTNALNVSLILGIMALPTIVSVSEDALQSTGRDLREGSYALGATRAETIVKVIIPAAMSGIFAAVILGIMRAVGETMVVWMASGNAAKIPTPFFNYLQPVRTLTATIAGDMGEADHVTGSSRFHVLFAMALSLLVFSFIMNLITEIIVKKRKK